MDVTSVLGSLNLESNWDQFTLNKAKRYRLAKKNLLGHEPLSLDFIFINGVYYYTLATCKLLFVH